MSIENDFDPVGYAHRIMKAKGFDPEANDEYADIFELQWPFWQDLINRHQIGDDLSRAEQILTRFAQRETFGGATKVLESFSKHLDAQPKQGGSPDWTTATRQMSECPYCENRGVVSNVPCRVRNKWGEEIERDYSFACVCDRGRYYAGMAVAQDWMLNFALDRRKAETAKARTNLKRLGVDPDAPLETQRRQYRQAVASMKSQVGKNGQTARTVQPVLPKTVEEARAMLASRKPAVNPPEQLNPDRLALAVFANGDERNEWE